MFKNIQNSLHYIGWINSQVVHGWTSAIKKETMIRHIFIILMLILFAGCGTDKESLPIADLDFDGLAQECFDSTARVRSSGSIGTASAIRYLIKKILNTSKQRTSSKPRMWNTKATVMSVVTEVEIMFQIFGLRVIWQQAKTAKQMRVGFRMVSPRISQRSFVR